MRAFLSFSLSLCVYIRWIFSILLLSLSPSLSFHLHLSTLSTPSLFPSSLLPLSPVCVIPIPSIPVLSFSLSSFFLFSSFSLSSCLFISFLLGTCFSPRFLSSFSPRLLSVCSALRSRAQRHSAPNLLSCLSLLCLSFQLLSLSLLFNSLHLDYSSLCPSIYLS